MVPPPLPTGPRPLPPQGNDLYQEPPLSGTRRQVLVARGTGRHVYPSDGRSYVTDLVDRLDQERWEQERNHTSSSMEDGQVNEELPELVEGEPIFLRIPIVQQRTIVPGYPANYQHSAEDPSNQVNSAVDPQEQAPASYVDPGPLQNSTVDPLSQQQEYQQVYANDLNQMQQQQQPQQLNPHRRVRAQEELEDSDYWTSTYQVQFQGQGTWSL